MGLGVAYMPQCCAPCQFSIASWNKSLILQGQIYLTRGGIFPGFLRQSPLLALPSALDKWPSRWLALVHSGWCPQSPLSFIPRVRPRAQHSAWRTVGAAQMTDVTATGVVEAVL